MRFIPWFYEEMGRSVYEKGKFYPQIKTAQFMESECTHIYGIKEFQFSVFIKEKKISSLCEQVSH